MITNIIENEKYKNLIMKQIVEIMDFLLKNNEEFAVTANIQQIEFNPNLPESIKKQLQTFSVFVLSNYTFSTIEIDSEYLYFEAGFGGENFGSQVKIPLYSIFQIVVDDSILYLNPLATVDKFHEAKKRDSFSVFKNNPINKKFEK